MNYYQFQKEYPIGSIVRYVVSKNVSYIGTITSTRFDKNEITVHIKTENGHMNVYAHIDNFEKLERRINVINSENNS